MHDKTARIYNTVYGVFPPLTWSGKRHTLPLVEKRQALTPGFVFGVSSELM